MSRQPFNQATRRMIQEVGDGDASPSLLDDPVAIHQAVTLLNFDFVEPSDIIAFGHHPRIARGTLLYLYWLTGPGYYCQFATRDEVPDVNLEGYEMGASLADAYLTRTDLVDGIAFDPRNHDGRNMTTDYADLPQVVAIDERLLQPVPGETVPPFEGFDLLTREPTATERAQIDAGIARARAMLPGLPADAPAPAIAAAIARALPHTGQPEQLAWLWLDQTGWPWRCGDSETDGVLFGVVRGGMTAYWPDIVRRTLDRGIDPATTVAFRATARRYEGAYDHAWWDEARRGLEAGWVVSTV